MSAYDRFDHLGKELLQELMKISPLTATYLGCHQYDHLLPLPSPESDFQSQKLFHSTIAKLDELNKTELDENCLLDLELLKWSSSLSDFFLDEVKRYRLGGYALEYFSGSLHPLFSREFAPLETRVMSIIGRLEGAGDFLEKSKPAYEVPVEIFIEEHVAGCPAAVEFIDNIVETVTPQISETLGKDLSKAAQTAKKHLFEFENWLIKEVMPRVGMNFALGKEHFTELIKLRRLGLNVDEIRALGEECFAQLQQACEEEAERIAPGQGIEGARVSLQEETFANFEEILAAYQEAILLARKIVEEQGFATLPPGDELKVEPTPPHLAISTPAAAYFPPEPMGPPPHLGIYVVTEPSSKSQLAEHYRAAIVNVSFHEAYPGHHLQALRALEHPSPIRRLINGDEFIEGWAHYCEEEMYKLAPQSHRGLRLAQLLDARYRALRIILDIGLHCGDISYEKGQQMMVEKLGAAPETARAEVCWYCREPGYALSYLLGKILFQRFREKVEKKEGQDFNMRNFHDKVLSQGNLPIWAMEKIILG